MEAGCPRVPARPDVTVLCAVERPRVAGKDDGIGVECLSGSAMIAGETSLAYDQIVTMTLVSGDTCRSRTRQLSVTGITRHLSRTSRDNCHWHHATTATGIMRPLSITSRDTCRTQVYLAVCVCTPVYLAVSVCTPLYLAVCVHR